MHLPFLILVTLKYEQRMGVNITSHVSHMSHMI